MSEPSLTPDAIEAEIRGLPVTDEVMVTSDVETLSSRDHALMQQCFDYLKSSNSHVLRTLQELCNRNQQVPVLIHYLATSLQVAGRAKEARAVARRLYRDFPDYLFARISMASYAMQDGEDPSILQEYLGSCLSLSAFPSHQGVYHVSEVKAFYRLVGQYHLKAGRIEIAERIAEVLGELVGDEDEAVRFLVRSVKAAKLEQLRALFEVDVSHELLVEPREVPMSAARSEPPSFHHAELEALYQYDHTLPEEMITRILGLPRETLLQDLEAVLRDAIDRGPLFHWDEIAWEDHNVWFPVHAITLLGELRHDAALPLVLELFAQPQELVFLWLDERMRPLEEPLAYLIRGRLPEVRDWMLQPALALEGRELLARAAFQLVLNEPAQRESVIEWFASLLEFLREVDMMANILDTRLVSLLMILLTDLRAKETLPLMRKLYSPQRLAVTLVGTEDYLARSLDEPMDTSLIRPFHGMQASYAEMRKRGAAEAPGEGLPPYLERPSEQPAHDLEPARPKPIKVGRNDPCLCGSGKKYKKCCGR